MIDNEDGTITDPRTGLTWEQAGSPKPYQQAAAIQYCTDLRLAGHTDWRLPELYELFSIIDHSRTNPAINPIFKAVANDYWSATTFATFPDGAWFVNFFSGYVYFDNKGFVLYVRAVRTGSKGKP